VRAIEKAILKDKTALQNLGAAVIEAGGYRLPETALLGGLLQVIGKGDLGEAAVANGEENSAAPPQESVADYIKKALLKDGKIVRGFGALVVHAGGYRLSHDALVAALRFIVRAHDADQQKREEWQAAGARFLSERNQPPRLRKSAPAAAGKKGKSQRPAANDSGGESAAQSAEKVAGVEA
jgi:hypothetical protein